jgi:hypothetical protein
MRSVTPEETKMQKREAIQRVRIEVLPPPDERKQRTPADAVELIRKMVEKQVAEILANRNEFMLRPFFDAKKVSDEISRLQTASAGRAWSRVFQKYGCIVCCRKDVAHVGCGCCAAHYQRILNRKKAAIRELERETEGCGLNFESDDSEIARQALAGVRRRAR